MKKKFLAGLLSLCMIFSLFPVVALADEPETIPTVGSTIYVDAENGDDGNENVGTSANTAYNNLETAVNNANSGDTIVLAAGKYTLYNKGANVLKKDLTFVGAGTDQTTWLIGPKVPDPAKFGTEYNSDYSFDVRSTDEKETVTFKNMTLQSGSVNYLGFAGTDNTVVENCVIDGKTFYWGNTSATFENTTFNCQPGDYAIWTYGTPLETFENCTFNSSGKIINVYADYNAKANDVTVNFKDCTVNDSVGNKPVLNINDSNKGDKKYYINISGNNTVDGVNPDNISCSRLFGFSGRSTNNTGKTLVTMEGTTVWKNGKSAVGHACDITAGGSYVNGVASGSDNQYTDGYKDDAFTTSYGDWITDENGIASRIVTKVCDYCGYSEEATEYLSLDGDILIGDETEHNSIYKATANTKMAITGSLNMAPVKEQMTQIRDSYKALPGDINLSDMTFVFTAKLTLPDALDYTENATATLDGANESFVVTKLTIEEKTATVEFQPTNLASIKTFSELQELVMQSGDELKATVDGVINNDLMKPDNNYTIEGSFIGSMRAKATHILSSKEINFNLIWPAKQSADGADFIDHTDLDSITFTLKYPQTYKVTYHANYGSTDQTQYGGTYELNDTHTTLDNGFARSGYRFTSWNTEPDGSGTSYDAGQPLAITENVDLYAQWKSSGGGGGGGGGSNEPDDPTPPGPTPDLLNTKDHYAYIVGYPAENGQKLVKPAGDITRAEVATIFFRMLTDDNRNTYWSQNSGYSDVAKDAWYNNAVSTLSNAGVLKGYQDGKFLPNGKITRAEFATIATRFFEIRYNGPDFFSDVDGHWAQDYINQAASANLVNGYPDGTFGPQKNITRAEAVTLVNRILQRYPDKDKLLSDMLVWPDNMDTSKWYYADVQEATNSHDYKRNTDGKIEIWTKLQAVRDWAAFEKEWSDANSTSNPGEVVHP